VRVCVKKWIAFVTSCVMVDYRRAFRWMDWKDDDDEGRRCGGKL